MTFMRFLADNRAFLSAGFLLAFASSFGQTFFISIFAADIKASFGLTDGAWGGVYTFGTTVSALVMVWAGVLTDKYRVRVLGPVVIGLLALSCALMAVITHWAALVFVIFALRVTGQGMLSQLSVVAMGRWFVATRGRALSIASMGYAFGQSVLPIAFVAAMAIIEWRLLWGVAALMVLALLPALIPLLRLERTPQSIADDPQSAGMLGRHWTRADMLRHPLFWFMVPLLMGPPTWVTALFFHQVHLTDVKGWALTSFVALTPLFIGVSVMTTFACGWAVDRWGTGRVIPVYLIPFVAAFALLSQADSIGAAALGMMVLGLGTGMQNTTLGAFWPEYYGSRNVGAIKSAAVAIMVFGSAIGPGFSGLMIDAGYTFAQQMLPIALYFAVAAAIATFGILRARASLTATA